MAEQAKMLEYLSVVTRDIQNIMSIIKGIAEYTDSTEQSINQRHSFAAFIKNEAQRIERTIACMTDAGNLFSKTVDYSFTPVNIDKMLESIELRWQETSGATLNIKKLMKISPIMADEDRLQTAFVILLDYLGTSVFPGVVVADLAPCEKSVGVRLYRLNRNDTQTTHTPRQSNPIRNLLMVNRKGFSLLGFSYAEFIIEAHRGKVWCIPDSADTVSFFLVFPNASGHH